MQSVNDDMDDLYRKAAENYELKTDTADWNKLLHKMEADTTMSGKNKTRTKYLLLLLLLPMFFICNRYVSNISPEGIITVKNEKVTAATQTKNGKSKIENRKSSETIQTDAANSDVASSKEKSNDNLSTPGEKVTKTPEVANVNKNQSEENLDRKINRKKIGKEKNPKHTNETNRNNSSLQAEPLNNADVIAEIKDETSTTDQTAIDQKKEEQPLKTDLSKIPNKEDSTTSPVSESKNKKKAAVPKRKLYWGVIAGPDFSMVKSTKVNGTGLSAGLLLGYELTKKFSVEAGILWDHKKYQSEGQYFKTEKLNWPHVRIIDVSGHCNMFEIPLNIRYTIAGNSRRSFFASAGISSYIMKSEDYNYYYSRYGVTGYGYKEYQNSSTDLLSIMQVSVGYQKNLGVIGTLRVEPYFKMPVKGVGIGSLPLRSSGIYVGVTRPIR